MEYASHIWDSAPDGKKRKLDQVYARSLRICCGLKRCVSYNSIIKESGFQTLQLRRDIQKLVFFQKLITNNTPDILRSMIPERTHTLFNNIGPMYRTDNMHLKSFQRHLINSAAILFNKLPRNVRDEKIPIKFKSLVKNLPEYTEKPSNYFKHKGKRNVNILFAQLRNRCSELKHDMRYKPRPTYTSDVYVEPVRNQYRMLCYIAPCIILNETSFQLELVLITWRFKFY